MAIHKPLAICVLLVCLLLACVVGAYVVAWQSEPNHTTTSDTTATQKVAPSPMVYDVATWQAPNKQLKPFANDRLLGTLGSTATQESALDFRGNDATRYHYHHRTAPPLYVVQSQELFEIAWYFATPHDKDSDKTLSQTYAQTAHALSHQVLGSQATPLLTALLAQKPSPLPTGVIYANCQAQLCQIVFDKGVF